MPGQTDIVRSETFAPILYAIAHDDLDEAIALHNEVRRAWRRRSSRPICARPRRSSARPAATAASPTSTSGRRAPRSAARSAARRRRVAARKSGSDAWKGYMRRQTNTVNYSRDLPSPKASNSV
ncbi:MAG: hypothetical protein R2697_13485 [Ilumatobacteraceae bacterium]